MKAPLVAIVAALPLLLAASELRAQCAYWMAGPLDDGADSNGATFAIIATTLWDPDGEGPAPPRLVAGGGFTSIGGVVASHIAVHNPQTGQWEPLGGGLNFDVYALTVFNGQIVAGGLGDNDVGTFDHIVRRWDGSSWQNIGTTNTGDVYALTVHNGVLYAGGSFMTHFTVSGQPANSIASWNEAAGMWENLNVGISGPVIALRSYSGNLVVGGNFTHAGGFSHPNIVAWNGAWQSMGGANGSVSSLWIFNGELIAGGAFTSIGGAATSGVAGWNGSSWHPFHTGLTGGSTRCLTTYAGQLVAGGAFTAASGDPVGFIARWNGSTWQPLGSGLNHQVLAMAGYRGELVVGGIFTRADDRPANYIARWSGQEWAPFGGGWVGGVNAMTNFGNRIVAGGDFHQSTTLSTAAHFVAAWDGMNLSPFGLGMNDRVFALHGFRYPGPFGSSELVAGGMFTHAGEVDANRIARWTESLVVFPPPAWEPMGLGFNDRVSAIERFNNVTYAAGAFTLSGAAPLNRIAKWNEGTDTWEPLGNGLNGFVFCMKTYGPYLYVGGNFSTAGGILTGGLARWDGFNWSGTGAILDGVEALEVHNGLLVVGGQFSTFVGSPNIIQFNGSSYLNIGAGGANSDVRALESNGGRLYAGGLFTTIGGVAANRVAYWDGAWHPVQGGADNLVLALGSHNGEVHAGGLFEMVDGGTSPGWARFTETGVPWIYTHPQSRNVDLGDDVSFTSLPAAEYGGMTYRWLFNESPLSNGPTGTGSTIIGATTTTLTVSNVTNGDIGAYKMVVTNFCGSDTSLAAHLTGPVGVGDPGTPGVTMFEALGPNPARGAAQIAYSLARDARVHVKIHDVTGRLVRLIDVGRLTAGRHQASWDARGNDGRRVQLGLYFVSLEVDGRRLGVKRLTVLR